MSTSDRRTTARLSRVFPVLLEAAGATVELHALDVSPTGVRVIAPGPLQASPFPLVLELEPGLALRLVGLTFTECNEQERALGRWVEAQLAA